jgi:hypothetical protein
MISVHHQPKQSGQARSTQGMCSLTRALPRLGAFLAVFVAASCTSDLVTSPSQPLRPALATVGMGGLPAVQQGDSAKADSLARGVALALANAELRRMVFTDFRDSPFPRHALDLTTYLRGGHAHALSVAIARELRISPEHVVEMAQVRGGLELVVPISLDRASWRGSDSIAVKGAAKTVQEDIQAGNQEFGYTTQGGIISIPYARPISSRLIAIEPRLYPFGEDPEGTRLKAPQHNRATLSTFADELHENFDLSRKSLARFEVVPCNNATALEPDTPCTADPGSGPWGVYLPSASSFSACVPNGGSAMSDASQDADQDGVRDSCEYELAQAFHPQMQFTRDDCDTSREPYWAVNYEISPIDGTPVIDIFYAIGYHLDCGSPRPDCPVDCARHFGDSEFIVAEVSAAGYPTYPSAANWYLKYVTLSAHYSTQVESTGTYSGSDVDYAGAAPMSNPVVWVSEGKHGNYRSQGVCDAGASYYDNCDRVGERVGLEILPDANLGSFLYPMNEITNSRYQTSIGSIYSGQEHMWSLTNDNGLGFLGWYPRSYGSGERPYGSLLKNYGF